MKEEMKRMAEEEDEENIFTFKSDLPLPPIPNTNYAAFMLNILAQHGEKKALMDISTGKHHTYSDVCAMVPRVCGGLARAGVGAGDAVLLMSPNHIDFPIANLAIMLLPAVCVPVNPALSPAEVAHVVRVSGARWAVVEEGVVGTMEKLAPLLPPNTLKGMWVMGAYPNHPSFASLMRTEAQESYNSGGPFEAASTVAFMPFSSGTTGLPKGVMLSHRSLLTYLFQLKHLSDLLGEMKQALTVMHERVLLVLPLYHIYGYNVCFRTMVNGGCLVLMGRFSFRSFLHAIQQHKITYAPIVPHMATYLLHSPLVDEYDMSSLLSFGTGSAPMPATTHEAFMERVGKSMGNGYGLTETNVSVSISTHAIGFKLGSVGRIMPYITMKIVAPGTKKGLPAGEEGEIWVRGPGVMMGYAQAPGDAPTTSAKGLEAGGWFPTGDLGKVDDEGFLFLTDRMKDLIKVKGYQVAPSELEAVLRGMEGVGDVAVVGVPSSRLGEAPRAFVVPTPGVSAPSPQALMEYVAARVAPYKRLEGGVELVESLPKNVIGKVLKRKLRDDFIKKTTTTTATTTTTGAATTTVPNSKL